MSFLTHPHLTIPPDWVKNICSSWKTYQRQVELTKKWTCLITLSEIPFVLGMRQLGAAEDYPTRVQFLASLRDSPYQDLAKKNNKFNWPVSCFWKWRLPKTLKCYQPFRRGPPGIPTQRPWFPINPVGAWSIGRPGGGPWKRQTSSEKLLIMLQFSQYFDNTVVERSQWNEFSHNSGEWENRGSPLRSEGSYLGAWPSHRWRVLGLRTLHSHEVINVHWGWTARVLLAWSKHVIHARVATSSAHATHPTAASTHRHWWS